MTIDLEPTIGRRPSGDIFLGGEQGILHLVSLLGHEERAIREKALVMLAEAGDARATQGLLNILDNKRNHPKQRAKAAKALGFIRSDSAMQSLAERLQEPHWYVRWQIMLALGRIGDQRAAAPLIGILRDDLSSFARQNAATALGSLRSEIAVGALVVALTDVRAIVREAAADALIQIGTQEAYRAVISYKRQQGIYD